MRYKWIAILCVFVWTSSLCAKNPQSWLQDLNLNKNRKVSQKNTSVAAVRGVEEIGDVDLEARNFEAVKELESHSYSMQEVDHFKEEGHLKEEKSSAPVVLELAGAMTISLEEECELGRSVASNVIAQFGLVKNESLTRYVNWVGLTVARGSNRPQIQYRFAVLDTPIINAFAAPCGYIFITRGLLGLLQDESQLAVVLGHEIGHVNRKHVLKEIQKSKLVEATIPSYVKSSAKRAQWMNQISSLAIQMLWKGLSREDELDADRCGVDYASRVGYQAQSMVEVLEILKKGVQTPKIGKEFKFLLSTHPKFEERLEAVQEKIKLVPADGARLSERFKKAVGS